MTRKIFAMLKTATTSIHVMRKPRKPRRKFGSHKTKRAISMKKKKMEALQRSIGESNPAPADSALATASKTDTQPVTDSSQQPLINLQHQANSFEAETGAVRQLCNLEGMREGRMVIDRVHFANSIANVCRHALVCQKGGHLSFRRVDIMGLSENWHFKCDKCQHSVTFSNTSPTSSNVEPNKALVWGMRLIGAGHNELQQVSAVSGLCSISKTTYHKIDLSIGNPNLAVNKIT